MMDNIMGEGEMKYLLTMGMMDNIMGEGEMKHLLTILLV